MIDAADPNAAAHDAAGHHPPPYLVGLRLSGRRVVVVGGGAVAARRVPALLRAGSRVTVVAPALQGPLHGLAAGGAIGRVARDYRPGDLRGAWYVLAATDDPEVNRAVAVEAEARRVFCVRADDAAGSTAHTPATGEQGGLLVAVLSAAPPPHPARVAAACDLAVEALRRGQLPARRPAGRG